MDFQELIAKRSSIRGYQDRPVEPEKLARILEAARLAPTAKNLQSFKLYIIATKKHQDKLRQVYSRDWFLQAPLTILICGIARDNWVRGDGLNYNLIDIAIVFDHLILAATAEGLGTCWVGAFDAALTKRLFKLPEDQEPLLFTPLGYAAEGGREKRRKPLEELIEYL